ncbi:MAG: hypothetical protein E7291_05910 [Lachnospiraceae bacterium]|nr:hypothetical protein [Lachnospiraceae bacterium]
MKLIRQIPKTLILLSCLLLSLTLAGCQKTGKLDEGDCKCNISFSDIPKEFTMLEENLLDSFEIKVVLENTVNETLYYVYLNQENDYFTQVSLHPGTYKINTASNNMSKYNNISLGASVESIELSAETTGEISITIDNPEEFSQSWMATQPQPEILLADKFSGQIQINRKIISITDIMAELELTPEAEEDVEPYEKMELTDNHYGITVTVLNNSKKDAPWEDCDVIAIRASKNTVVFPEGVTLGMAADKVLDKQSGLYGEPDACTGSLLFGWQLDDTQFLYNDLATGNKITISLSPDGTYVSAISYELACFE